MTKDNNSIDRTLDIDSDKKTYDEFGNLNEGVEIMSVTKIVANPNQPRKNSTKPLWKNSLFQSRTLELFNL